ncbi:pseudouridine synthase [Corynebacterium felinum]|uniref:Pseudouridine synthase n=1 Tax=Corynebacterium felinum TaxID=131318 RepID=A0ABU2BAB9_9CORY|nr:MULTISPECIES: pseudouridine synthase [Corynebacterium]MDF5819721.1 pseudouridine synthase [Corynebacterium felinum]MDO4761894.1 pseudouridine synthase [Corynebacterium sp.]MDR7355561.1 23S rRNA pseudouridine2605 synthase [Corynebacterium felinum]WJY94911.1 Ribosomal large subunit pseudouridine synthase B [Corynebacterium felinum]
MSRTARRDGTPENNRSYAKARPQRGGQGAKNLNKRGKAAAGKPEKQQRKQRDSEILLSNARPAKRQHVAPRATNEQEQGELIRLQKVLAKAGVASRRHAEILIDAGRVEVNGKIIMEQGTRVNPNTDVIRVDGVRVNVNEKNQYFVLNKPRGLHSTMSDELGRPCIGDIISERIASGQRLFHVGRLDADTEGLLLLTNDGELANRLMHPKYEVSKTYLATVLGEADRALIKQLRDGIELDDGPAKADYVQIIDTYQGKSLIRVELHEGRKHIVRRMLKAAGYPVQALVRTKLHTVQLGEQKPGTIRALNDMELTSLYKAVDM